MSERKKNDIQYSLITFVASAIIILFCFLYKNFYAQNKNLSFVKVGFVYNGDASNLYSANFIRAAQNLYTVYQNKVQVIERFNVPKNEIQNALEELVSEGCNVIFTTSSEYQDFTKEFARKNPEIEFCQASANNANSDEILPNYHSFMATIYQARYVTGIVAGLKLEELIKEEKISREEAKIGYVASYLNSEVISGFTAFLLGIRSVVPDAKMTVRYTNSFGNPVLEKEITKKLIEEDDCVIISHHTDTSAVAIACEEAEKSRYVYFVGYTETMRDVAPVSYLTSCKINWEFYIKDAVGAVLNSRKIEKCVDATVNKNDSYAGFEKGWISVLDLNEFSVADHTLQKIEEVQNKMKKKSGHSEIQVFSGNYTGINSKGQIINLQKPYVENKNSSYPTFDYILNEVIEIK